MGKYVPAGQFLAKRQIWAAAPIGATITVPTPNGVTAAIPAIGQGARISVNPTGGGVGSAAAVFQTRFENDKNESETVVF